MNVMRYTIIDDRGGVSFVGHCDLSTALVAGCSHNPSSLEQLLERADSYYHSVRDYVLNGLAVFDEHNADGHYESIHEALESRPPAETPVFRVVDDATREASLRPVKAGAIIFNLMAKRIIQMQNTYSEIRRRGGGRLFDGQRLTNRVFRYQLPEDWTLVP